MRLLLCILLALSLGAPALADEDTIILSTMSSDGTSASVLTAELKFDVNGSTLTLTVKNSSQYDIMDVYFNADHSKITDLTLSPLNEAWTLYTPSQNGDTKANGFGTFSFRLGGNDNTVFIRDGLSASFTFSIAGSGPFSAVDFTHVASIPPPADELAAAAAKFQSGPGGDSAFGATQVVPEPATLVYFVMAMGLVGLVRWRRRRSAA